MLSKDDKLKAGHYEILGETLAKFELFEAGWNPYERYLDVDKVDLILRRRTGQKIIYREVQVKYEKLYDVSTGWKAELFDRTSWQFFNADEFAEFYERPTTSLPTCWHTIPVIKATFSSCRQRSLVSC
jgi:hypothetical protein